MTAVEAVVWNNHYHRATDVDKNNSLVSTTFSNKGLSYDDRHRNTMLLVDDLSSFHPVGLIEEWIATIKEETRLQDEKLRMTTTITTRDNSRNTYDDEDDDMGEWDYDDQMMMADEEEEFDHDDDEWDADEDSEMEELLPLSSESHRTTTTSSSLSSSLTLSSGHRHHHRRKMQVGGRCVQNPDGLQTAVRGSSPSKTTIITVCTQRMKLGSTARRRRRRRLQKQPAVCGVTGGGINFSNRHITLRCQYIRTKCILDGEEISRIFYGTNTTLYIIGFQFFNATANDKFGSGSALSFLENSVITIRDCSFVQNQAKKSGGAILLHDSILSFRNSRTSRTNFFYNQAPNGGAIYSINSTIDTMNVYTPPKIITLNNNQARNDGGGIFMIGGSVALNNFVISNNAANNGGGGVFIDVDVTISNVDVTYNTANTTGGGFVFFDSTINATNATVTNNHAGDVAGGVYLNNSNLYIQNGVLQNNQARYGGGIYSINSTIETMMVYNPSMIITLINNQAIDDGGGIYMIGGRVALSDFVMYNNAGNNGGVGVFIGVDVTLNNFDVSYNTANTTGGGFVFFNSTINATNATVTNNHAGGVAGGISFTNSNIFLQNGLVQNNTANSTGGILLLSSIATIDEGYFDSNNATFDGGAATIISSNVTFIGTVILNNTGGSTAEDDYSATNDSVVIFIRKCFTTNAELRSAVTSYKSPITIQKYGNISDWCVTYVKNFFQVFYTQRSFNEDISKWDTSNATTVSRMFQSANSFNQDISKWDVSKVTDTQYMFVAAKAFNQDISKWDVSKVTNMLYMFAGAISFNQNISSWNISKVTTIANMFDSATSFNQDLCSWHAICQFGNKAAVAFSGTSCPNRTNPICGSGSFCFNCN